MLPHDQGPAVLLMHMCNTTRTSWESVAQQLSAAGISALTIDNRGFGESGGPRFDPGKPEVQRQLNEKWPGDFDAAFAWLVAQPGVDKSRIGAGGGSCGVNNAVKLASRHPEVRSLVLLAGGTDSAGVKYLEEHPSVPIFTAAAADDQFDSEAPQLMRWFAELSGNPRNRFVGFKDGRHGTEIFGPHPELPRQIVAWFVDTLVKSTRRSCGAIHAEENREFRILGGGHAARRRGECRTTVFIFVPGRLLRNYRRASRLKEAAVVRMPSAYGVPAKPNSLANLLESKRYGPSLWYSIS